MVAGTLPFRSMLFAPSAGTHDTSVVTRSTLPLIVQFGMSALVASKMNSTEGDSKPPFWMRFGAVAVNPICGASLIGATVIIENIFSLPGIGQYLLQGILTRDYTVVQAIVLVFAIITVLANLMADVLYAVLDPRIRYGNN